MPCYAPATPRLLRERALTWCSGGRDSQEQRIDDEIEAVKALSAQRFAALTEAKARVARTRLFALPGGFAEPNRTAADAYARSRKPAPRQLRATVTAASKL